MRVVTQGIGWPAATPGGINRYVADLHGSLQSLGIDSRVLVFGELPGSPENVHSSGPESAPLPIRLIRSSWAAKREVKQASILAAHFALYGLIPALISRLKRKPVVAHFHGPWAGESRASGQAGVRVRFKVAVEKCMFRLSNRFIVTSGSFRQLLHEQYGVADEQISVVTPGVDLEYFRPAEDRDQTLAFRRGQGIDDATFVAFTARRLVPRMGLDVVIRNWPDHLDAILVIAGAGTEEEALRGMARGKAIRLVGPVTDDDLAAWLRHSDVVVVPSVALEGFGLVVLEALASGTPVLASAIGGLTEVLPKLGQDLLVPAGDGAAWQERIRRAVETRDLPSTGECRRLASQYSLEAFGRSVLAVYDEVIRLRVRR